MTKKIQRNIAFYAATLNIVASSFFVDATYKRVSDPNNVSESIGLWLFGASLLLWIIYVVFYIVTKSKK